MFSITDRYLGYYDQKGQKLQAADLFIGIGFQFFASNPNSDSDKGALALIFKMKCAAIAQLCSTASKRKNLENIAKCANMAKWHGASMLFLPECFGFIGSSPQQTLANAEAIPHSDVNNASVETKTNTNNYHSFQEKQQELLPWLSDLEQIVETGEKKPSADASTSQKDGDAHSQNSEISILRGLRTIAVKSGLWISGGGIHEKGAPPSPVGESSHSRVYNTHIIIDSNGRIVTKYRKVHLFDVSIPSEGVNLRESATTAPGSKLVVCDSPIGKLGLSICYDLRFPEMYTKLVEEGGADILLVPSAFTVPTGRAHWHTLLRARAIENQSYILAAAQYGTHNEKRKSYGHSIAIDPWGEVLEDAGGYDGQGTRINADEAVATPGVVICHIDDKKLKSIRERMPIRKHRAACTFSW